MIKVSWDLAESRECANVPGNTNISLKTMLLAFDNYIYTLVFFVSLDYTSSMNGKLVPQLQPKAT